MELAEQFPKITSGVFDSCGGEGFKVPHCPEWFVSPTPPYGYFYDFVYNYTHPIVAPDLIFTAIAGLHFPMGPGNGIGANDTDNRSLTC